MIRQSSNLAAAPLPKVLWPLLFGNFVIGTGVMVVAGTLNDISNSLAISVAMYAGQALGAGSGGWLIVHDGMGSLHWFGLAALLAAMAMSWWASRQRPHAAD